MQVSANSWRMRNNLLDEDNNGPDCQRSATPETIEQNLRSRDEK